MRGFHRWVMTVAVVVLLYLSASGLVVAVYDYTDRRQGWAQEGGGPGTRPRANPDVASLNDDNAIAGSLESARRAALALTETPLTTLELRLVDGVPQVTATTSGDAARALRFDAAGVLLANDVARRAILPGLAPSDPMPGGVDASLPPAGENLHGALESWHRASFLDLNARYLAIAGALALILLAVSGGVLYLQLRRARRQLGHRQWFWS